MSNWVEISVGIFTVVYTSVNIVKGIWSFYDLRQKQLESIIADAVDFTWITYVKNMKKSGNWNDNCKDEATQICKKYINNRLTMGCCITNIRLERLINDRINLKKKNKYIKKNNHELMEL